MQMIEAGVNPLEQYTTAIWAWQATDLKREEKK